MVAEHVIHGTLNLLLVLFSALAELVQVELVLLLILRVHVLGVVRTRRPLVAIGILGSVCRAVRRLRSNLHFPPRRIASLDLVHWMRA